MLVGSLTAQESQAAFLRGSSPEVGGRTDAGTAANMTGVVSWRGRCAAPGKSPQVEGTVWLQRKAVGCLRAKSCRHLREIRGGFALKEFLEVRAR